jgi:hypothetical protein
MVSLWCPQMANALNTAVGVTLAMHLLKSVFLVAFWFSYSKSGVFNFPLLWAVVVVIAAANMMSVVLTLAVAAGWQTVRPTIGKQEWVIMIGESTHPRQAYWIPLLIHPLSAFVGFGPVFTRTIC